MYIYIIFLDYSCVVTHLLYPPRSRRFRAIAAPHLRQTPPSTAKPSNQSHYVNARTSEDWFQENNGHIVRGRRHWLSPPLKVVRPTTPTTATAAAATATARPPVSNTVDANARADKSGGLREDGGRVGATPSGASGEKGGGGDAKIAPGPALLGVAVLAALGLAALVARAWGLRRFGGGAAALVRFSSRAVGWLLDCGFVLCASIR